MTELEIHHLDVGQGDCCLIIVRDSISNQILRTALIDCGGGENGVDDLSAAEALLEACTAWGVDHIDIVVITHYEQDHFGGFYTLLQSGINNLRIQQLFQNTRIYDRGQPGRHLPSLKQFTILSNGYYTYALRIWEFFYQQNGTLRRRTEFMRAYPEEGGPYSLVNTGFTKGPNSGTQSLSFDFADPYVLLNTDLMNFEFQDQLEVELKVVVVNRHRLGSPQGTWFSVDGMTSDENNNCICLLLKMGNFTYWFPGELEERGEAQCVDALASLGVTQLSGMKIAHHGSDYSTSQVFMDTLRPNIAVISCGPGNRHDHPGMRVMNLLDQAPYVRHVFLTGYGGPTDDPRNPAFRSPFDRSQKFQFAGSGVNSRLWPGHISIKTNLTLAMEDDPRFTVGYFGQNVLYEVRPVVGNFTIPNDLGVFQANQIINANEISFHPNLKLDHQSGIVYMYGKIGLRYSLLAEFHPRGQFVEFNYPQ